MGPFEIDSQGFRYLLTMQDHTLTFSVVYPLKSRLDSPNAMLDAITHLLVQLGTMPKALQTDNTREFVLANFTTTLSKMGVGFYPLLPYSPQENSEAEKLNHTLGDMARAMMTQSDMLMRFWQYAYASACYIHNWLPNSSPHQVLYGQPPSISTLYSFRSKAIVHVPAVHQQHKLALQGIECRLLKRLLASCGWLLWDPADNRMIHSARVIFPRFQTANISDAPPSEGLLPHVLNAMTLGEVPTKVIFRREEAIDSLPLAKDISSPEHLGQAMLGLHRRHWEQACFEELNQMQKREVWCVVDKEPGMRTISHCWVFDTKLNKDGSVKKFKACLVARGDRQHGDVCSYGYFWPPPAFKNGSYPLSM
ncbi:hypothetical protein O181_034439 [Austropuccinia psidii MF-1]|uniref:Integrase catalytic domain-containing protein n=1 Tax=Austropuccinia psidii MF-1 TaxID=1389203 RepID=A0A9Q3H9J3_9BASI|nr:hypothetical protein [Austropuccinia psidii MF-1]